MTAKQMLKDMFKRVPLPDVKGEDNLPVFIRLEGSDRAPDSGLGEDSFYWVRLMPAIGEQLAVDGELYRVLMVTKGIGLGIPVVEVEHVDVTT